MNALDRKINKHFEGLVVRKDLVKTVKGNAIVPSYVLEYLLGQYCATSDEDSIQSGIETVRNILRQHYVHRNEADLVKSRIRERGLLKVIDKVTVKLNEDKDAYEASFANLGISGVLIDADTVNRNEKLLVGGVWCIAEIEYQYTADKQAVPWILESLKPIQISHFDFDRYLEARKHFNLEEWVDLLMQSIGLNPEMYGWRDKLIQLTRLVPYCERNYNLLELGPKGTGKSHIYSEFSPHGILISGGEVTVPKLFVNNRTNDIGLVGYWDVVAFDEFTGKKRKNQALVDILKNYMANKSFSRGVETIGAEASIAFVGNTNHNVPFMLKHADLFEPIPEQYHDSAFLDRLHFYIPGWEVEIIRDEMFSDGYGFVLDYLAEILRHMRDFDFTHKYTEHFELLSGLSTRDQDGINKTFSGLMKVLFPGGEASEEHMEMILQYAAEGRKRVKDQLMRIDPTYDQVEFGYRHQDSGETSSVKVLEEKVYPQHYHQKSDLSEEELSSSLDEIEEHRQQALVSEDPALEEKHLTFEENQRGVSFEGLFGPYLEGASKILVQDPFIRAFYQTRNMMEFVETVIAHKDEEDEVDVHLVTSEDDDRYDSRQVEYLEQIKENTDASGVNFSWEFQDPSAIHARHILTDTGWKIILDRGLDIFQRYDMNDAFTLSNRMQEQRAVKAFEVTYLQVDEEKVRTAWGESGEEAAAERGDFVSGEPLEALVNLNESKTLEFKSTLQWDVHQDKLNQDLRHASLKTITSFMNTEGGTLLIGVNDDGEIYGLENDLKTTGKSLDKYEQLLTSLISDRIGPSYGRLVDLRFDDIDGAQVCVIDVQESPEPVFLKGDSGKEFHVRVGNTSRLLDSEDTVNYIKMNWD